jgi:hypothetical protein
MKKNDGTNLCTCTSYSNFPAAIFNFGNIFVFSGVTLKNADMKKIFSVIFSLLFVCISAFAQDNKPEPKIEFEENSFDFGDIHQGDVVQHIYKFTNTGTQPLVISEVVTTCGCTVPKWSKDPVMPGKTGEIVVNFNSANKMGRQNKGITILSNAANNPARISLICNVLPKKE